METQLQMAFPLLNSNILLIIIAEHWLFSITNGLPVLQDGTVALKRLAVLLNAGNKDSQMAEYGLWCNRRFVNNFTNSAPVDTYFTGVEFTNWHNRFKITFHIKPTAINNANGHVICWDSSEYLEYYNSGSLHAFGLDINKGLL
jgi:hypothetical protein